MNRLEPLDWLRGLLALSIMVYHLIGWKFHQPDSSELLGRLGIYGVSMFFVLSGLSMAAVYAGFIGDARSWASFFVRRIFRIWPLLWAAVITVTVGGVVVKGEPVDWSLVLLNLTTLFGFVSPGAYINTGAWSIGNEMVYYALTPALLAVYNRSTRSGNVVLAATIIVGMYFAFAAFDRRATLAHQWQTYIHPANNLMFYVTGVALYYNARNRRVGLRTPLAVLLASLAVLALYPSEGDLVSVVSGSERVAFLLACAGIVFGFYRMSVAVPRWLSRPFAALGVATYGVYLLHPIVFQIVELAALRLALQPSPAVVVGMTIAATIALSLVTYDRFEAPLIRLGKRLTSRPIREERPSVGSPGPTLGDRG
jgi:peptidoglycan/LPS O-acetylase OafA/YrhL